jgi:hypothetical protein
VIKHAVDCAKDIGRSWLAQRQRYQRLVHHIDVDIINANRTAPDPRHPRLPVAKRRPLAVIVRSAIGKPSRFKPEPPGDMGLENGYEFIRAPPQPRHGEGQSRARTLSLERAGRRSLIGRRHASVRRCAPPPAIAPLGRAASRKVRHARSIDLRASGRRKLRSTSLPPLGILEIAEPIA